MSKTGLFVVLSAMLALTACGKQGGKTEIVTTEQDKTEVKAETYQNIIAASDAIVSVKTNAFVDVDGPKVNSIVIEYNTDIPSEAVTKETYDAYTYANLPQEFDVGEGNGGEGTEPYTAYPSFQDGIGSGTPGEILDAYVSADPSGFDSAQSGRYVILIINTDYRLEAVSSDWRAGVAGGIIQVKDINGLEYTIESDGTTESNYEPGYFWDINPFGSNHSVTLQKVFDDSLYTLSDLDGYDIYTDNKEEAYKTTHEAIDETEKGWETDRRITYKVADATVLSKVKGDSFKAIDCFSEYDGTYHDVNLMYNIFVPKDYDASKKYAMILHMTDAGGLGDDPMIALTECQAAANYASDRVQQLVKDQGLDGLIVVIPQIPKSGQTVSDNLTGNEYIPATWQLIDHITEQYSIDMNRIFASGQSMGGMQILDMASQRDNYFAGIWAIGSQWGNNYNKEAVYGEGPNAHGYSTYPVDGDIVTNKDWQNWYYSISDDNILATNMTGDASATNYWEQVKDLFKEFADIEVPYTEWNPLTNSVEEQNALLKSFVSQDNQLGIYWNALSDGNHKSTWIYAHALSSGYDWLLSQTKESENARGKLNSLFGEYSDQAGTTHYNSDMQ